MVRVHVSRTPANILQSVLLSGLPLSHLPRLTWHSHPGLRDIPSPGRPPLRYDVIPGWPQPHPSLVFGGLCKRLRLTLSGAPGKGSDVQESVDQYRPP